MNEKLMHAQVIRPACESEHRQLTRPERPSQALAVDKLTCDGRQVRQVAKGRGGTRRDIHVGEQANERGEDEAVHGQTVLGAAAENCRRFPVTSETADRG